MPTFRSRAPLALVLVSAGCASRGTAAAPDAVQVQESARVITPGSQTSSVVQTRAVSEDVVRTTSAPAAPGRVWEVLPGAYEELKLPVTMRADAQRQLGAQGRRVRGSIGGTRMSLMFSCGVGATGGDAADSYELTIDVVSQVIAGPTPNESVVRTMASGVARPLMTSGEPVRCVSNGRLEEKIAAAVAKRLAS